MGAYARLILNGEGEDTNADANAKDQPAYAWPSHKKYLNIAGILGWHPSQSSTPLLPGLNRSPQQPSSLSSIFHMLSAPLAF